MKLLCLCGEALENAGKVNDPEMIDNRIADMEPAFEDVREDIISFGT